MLLLVLNPKISRTKGGTQGIYYCRMRISDLPFYKIVHLKIGVPQGIGSSTMAE